MNNLTDNLVNQIYGYSIGDAHFNAADVVYEYFSNKIVRYKDLDINIINCWFHLYYKFKHYMINNILHILIYNNHPFYNDIEYYLLS